MIWNIKHQKDEIYPKKTPKYKNRESVQEDQGVEHREIILSMLNLKVYSFKGPGTTFKTYMILKFKNNEMRNI